MANEKKLNTRIVLRNDQLSNWTAETAHGILKGETALAFNDDGSFELRVGKGPTGNEKWDEAARLRLSSDQIAGLDKELAQLSASHYVTDDIDKLSATYNAGDTAVVSSEIGDGTGNISYTAYVYDGKLSAWKAMDGNYDADNVYFDSDFTLAGDYDEVGNVKLTDGTVAAKGKSVSDLMTQIFTKELYPTATLPTFKFTATSGTGEIGVSYTNPTATLTMTNVGSYTYGPATGITVPATSATLSCTQTTALTSNSVAMPTAKTVLTAISTAKYLSSGYTYNYRAAATYTSGAMPVTNLGNDYDSVQIQSATSVLTARGTYTGYFPTFYIVTTTNIATPTKLDSSTSKDENGVAYTKEVNGTYAKTEFTDPDGWRQIFYLTPSVKCSYTSWSGTDSSSNLPVNPVATQTAEVTLLTGDKVTYKVFIVQNSAKGSAGTATMVYA